MQLRDRNLRKYRYADGMSSHDKPMQETLHDNPMQRTGTSAMPLPFTSGAHLCRATDRSAPRARQRMGIEKAVTALKVGVQGRLNTHRFVLSVGLVALFCASSAAAQSISPEDSFVIRDTAEESYCHDCL